MTADSRTLLRADARDVLEEQEVAERRQADAGERALRDDDVVCVPQADVGHVARDNPLDLGVTARRRRSSSVDAPASSSSASTRGLL